MAIEYTPQPHLATFRTLPVSGAGLFYLYKQNMLPLPIPKWALQEEKLLLASGIFPAASLDSCRNQSSHSSHCKGTNPKSHTLQEYNIHHLPAEAGIFFAAAVESDILNPLHFSGICVSESPLTGCPSVPAAASSKLFIYFGNYHTISTISH